MKLEISEQEQQNANLIAGICIDYKGEVRLIITKCRTGAVGTYVYESKEEFLEAFPKLPEINL